MTIKKILVLPNGSITDASVLAAATSVARDFGGHLAVTYIKPGPPAMAASAYESVPPDLRAELKSHLESGELENEERARRAFEALIKSEEFAIPEEPQESSYPSASWQVVDGYAPDVLAHRAGTYDLIVIGTPHGDGEHLQQQTLESALFDTGRPVLVVPQSAPSVVGETTLIAWNRSGPSARAFHAAKALLLEKAKRIQILSVLTGAKEGPPAEDVADNLAWHGIKAEIREIPPDHRAIGEMLVSEASDLGADLIVMGAYSHSRVRQMILGGVTTYMLAHTTIPVLMAH